MDITFKKDLYRYYGTNKEKLNAKLYRCSAPTQSLLAKWLRKEHGIYIELLIDGWSDDDCVTDDFLCYRCFIWQVGKPRPKHNEDLGAGEYEKMFEIGLQEALKLI